MIFEKTLSTIKKYNLIEKGDKIVLGLSGGPDSVCLLHISKSSNKRVRSTTGCIICFSIMRKFRSYFFC